MRHAVLLIMFLLVNGVALAGVESSAPGTPQSTSQSQVAKDAASDDKAKMERKKKFKPVRDAYARQDYATAVKLLKGFAEQGDVDAQIGLGTFHYYGLGTPRDYAQAIKLWTPLAEKGNANAHYALAAIYSSGQGAAVDLTKAFEHYLRASERGLATAQLMTCSCYMNGMGTKMNWPEALKWCRKAADQGETMALFYMGQIYQNGIGVPKDDVEAYFWYSLGVKSSAFRLPEKAKSDVGKRLDAWRPMPTDITAEANEFKLDLPADAGK